MQRYANNGGFLIRQIHAFISVPLNIRAGLDAFKDR